MWHVSTAGFGSVSKGQWELSGGRDTSWSRNSSSELRIDWVWRSKWGEKHTVSRHIEAEPADISSKDSKWLLACRSVLDRRGLGFMGQYSGKPGCAVMPLGQQRNFQYICSLPSGSTTGWQEVEGGTLARSYIQKVKQTIGIVTFLPRTIVHTHTHTRVHAKQTNSHYKRTSLWKGFENK